MSRYELSIEVLDAAFPASGWKDAFGDMLSATAVEHGAVEWRWVERSWGVVFEVAFASDLHAQRWNELPAVTAAFDAVPDPVSGLVFHIGWGGTSGSGEPRRKRPLVGAGGAEVPIPVEVDPVDAIADGVREGAGEVIRTQIAASA